MTLILVTLLFISSVFYAVPQVSPAHDEHLPALVISSYSSSFHTFSHQIGPINERLLGHGIPYELIALDSKRIPSGPVREELDQEATEWIAEHGPYRLIVTADDYALQFVLERQAELFPRVPVVFLGVNNLGLAASMDDNPWVTGVVERSSMVETLALMRRLFPDRERLIAISDATVSGRADLATFRELTAEMPDVDAWTLDAMTHEELASRLAAADGENAYLVLSPYTDTRQDTRSLSAAIAALRAAAPDSPFFHLWRHGLEDGLIGGVILSHEAQAMVAMDLTDQILGGTDIADLPVVQSSPNRRVLNYPILRDFRVPLRRIPLGTRLLDGPILLRETTRHWITTGGVIAIGLGVGLSLLNIVFGHYRALFRDSASVMMLLDPATGRIRSVNRAAARYYGYPVTTIRRMRVQDFNTLSDSEVQNALVATTHGTQNSFEFCHRLANGEERDVAIFSGPVGHGRHQKLYSIIHDITARKTAERQLDRARKAAEEASSAKSRFVASVSHELRTPLSGMLGMISLLEQSPLDGDQKTVVEHLRDAGRDLSEIIESLLSFSRVSGKGVPVTLAPFDVSRAFEHAQRYLTDLAGYQGVRLHFETPAVPLWVESDRGKLNQILVNLVSNAVKYSAGVGNRANARVSVSGTLLHIDVADTGPGIPEDELPSLFEPFTRGSQPSTGDKPGLGLGLSITKDLTDLLSGEIHVSNHPAGGTHMRVTVPVARCEASGDDKPVSTDGDAAESQPGPVRTVLVVEDDRINRLFFVSTLRNAGFVVREAGSTEESVASAAENPPDIILMDVNLPDGSGIDATERIRALGGEFLATPIIALTAYATEEDRRKTKQAGMDGHLTKPIRAQELVNAVRQLSDIRTRSTSSVPPQDFVS